MTIPRCGVVIWPAVILVGCYTGKPRSDAITHSVRSMLDSLNVELDSAYRTGSAAGVVALFTPDATLSLIGLVDIRGRDGITALLTSFFGTNVVQEFRLRSAEIEAYDSVAYERGTFTWAAGPRAAVPKVEHGRYSVVRRRMPTGQWLIHRFLENLVPATDSTAVATPRAG
jgi:ketosteroid isomerase-like protein